LPTFRGKDWWYELAAILIPASIVQQDFRHGNLVMSRRFCLFYDWSDTVVSHHFFACCRLAGLDAHRLNAAFHKGAVQPF
jgi:hypothetical protein